MCIQMHAALLNCRGIIFDIEEQYTQILVARSHPQQKRTRGIRTHSGNGPNVRSERATRICVYCSSMSKIIPLQFNNAACI